MISEPDSASSLTNFANWPRLVAWPVRKWMGEEAYGRTAMSTNPDNSVIKMQGCKKTLFPTLSQVFLLKNQCPSGLLRVLFNSEAEHTEKNLI